MPFLRPSRYADQIRIFLLLESLAFAAAALVHLGALGDAYAHFEARIAETVIAVVLIAGLLLSAFRPSWTRRAGIVAQGFALLGTLVGVFTIMVGVGPQSVGDIIYHIAIILILVWGLRVALRGHDTEVAKP